MFNKDVKLHIMMRKILKFFDFTEKKVRNFKNNDVI